MIFFVGEHGINNIEAKDSLKEAIGICETALRNVKRQRFWYLLSGCALIIPLIWSISLDCMITSLGVNIGLNVGRIVLTAILCYTLFMSSIWNNVEKNALKAVCSAIEIHLMQLNSNINQN